MRSLLFILAALAVIGSGYWAYHENYATQAELDRVDDLRSEIGGARERLAILRAEWAYLNRPDRLRDLADLNFDKLGLLALRPDQFGRVDQVSYPPLEQIDVTQPVDVISTGTSE
ncbi:hypothetical protein [Tropicibacter naphthalenivorans]|uniref:Putative secreted (Periplasmic) protein n=1 Tax=Tropicibacter naphthalenivorans TaxID=441103 RepID=A0A0P1GIS6_9RHOB|nr:hypothetical protein [Tropicibacter naphthalenivorans]CUH76072.1 putative secreted (periplasmic) protein [Tropicibacter naphthalenivorans]SMC40172.1 hypothetical protein SAMN04488093_101117 [Tropicibacter naphthalenivorans]